MNNPNTQNERIRKMIFGSVYPLYLAKVEKKGRTKEELNQLITWLTGYDNKKLEKPNEVIDKCWWIKPNYVRVAKSILRHRKYEKR